MNSPQTRPSPPWRTSGVGHAAALALTIAAVTWTLVGVGVATGVAGQPDAAPHVSLPTGVRVALWWAGAAACVVVLAARRYAAAACAVLIAAPSLRIGSYLWAWGTDVLSGDGHASGWYAAAIHAPLVGLIFLIALLTRTARVEGITR